MSLSEHHLPGTSTFYNKHIYPRLGETIPIGSFDTPSTALNWAMQLGIINPQQSIQVLEIGCGAGRNLVAIQKLLPHASLHGFDGSPLALEMARTVLLKATLREGDLHGVWPFDKEFDVIFDITSGIPESPTEIHLYNYAKSLYKALKLGEYAVIDAIAPTDPSSKRFGSGNIVIWEHQGETKPERLMNLEEARQFYQSCGFRVIAARVDRVEQAAFNENLQREYIQLIIQKPL